MTGAALFMTWYVREVGWVRLIPTPVLIASSPWLDWNDAMEAALVNRLSWLDRNPLPEWEAAMAKRISHRVVRTSDEPRRVLLHAWILLELSDADDETGTAVLALTNDPDPTVVTSVANTLGSLKPNAKIEAALGTLTQHPSRAVQDSAMRSLWIVKRTRPGGPAPALALADAVGGATGAARAAACRVLGLCDPSEPAKGLLLTAAAAPNDAWERTCAIGALAKLYPDDPGVQAMVVEALHDPAFLTFTTFLALDVLGFDERALDAGSFTPARSVLSNEQVRTAVIDTANAESAGAWDWVEPRRVLRRHPCLSEGERARVRIDEAAEAQERERFRTMSGPR